MRRQRPETEAHFRARRDHVGLDAAFDAADVEAQAGQAAEARDAPAPRRNPARARPSASPGAARWLSARRAPEACPAWPLNRISTELMPRCASTASHRVGSATIDLVEAMRRCARNAAMQRAIVGFLVAAEQERGIAAACACAAAISAGRRALDVAGAEADRAVAVDAQLERIGAPVRRDGHGVEVHVEQRASACRARRTATPRRRRGRSTSHVEVRAAARAGSRRCRRCRSRAADCACRTRPARRRCVSVAVEQRRSRSRPRRDRAIDFGPQRAAHAEQLDEAFGLGHAPVGRLRVGRALGVEDVRRLHGDRIDAAAARFQRRPRR